MSSRGSQRPPAREDRIQTSSQTHRQSLSNDKHVETTDHIKAAVNIFDQEDAEDDSLELLQGAENGRYKVIAKAEPYKNLPPAPVTPEDDYFPVTPSPAISHLTSNYRQFETTPEPDEELKFALINDAKTQKYVPVRQTPAYEVTTPRFSVTPPALEFEPTPAQLKGKKKPKSKSKPQHTRFKISVDDEDVNNFQPTPPPTTPPTVRPKHKSNQHKHKNTPKRPKPTPAVEIKPHRGNSDKTKSENKHKTPGYFVSKNADRESDLITNEIESGSSENNKVQAVSTSIYDPRPKSRSYKKNYNSYKRERIPKKYSHRHHNQHKNYNLPIRDQKKSKKSFSTKKSKHQFNPEVEGFESDERQFETVKREGAHSVHNNQDPVVAEPIFLSSSAGRPAPVAKVAPAPVHVKSLLPRAKPTFQPAPASPFTAFTVSPEPFLLSQVSHTTVAPPATPPPPSPTPPLVQFPLKQFASFAPQSHAPQRAPVNPAAPLRPAPAPLRPTPAPLHPAPVPLHHTPSPPPPPPPAPAHLSPVEPYLEPEPYDPESYEPKPYSYNFGVNDAYSGVDYNRAEERSDSGVTRGSYTVKLPDGRIQTVSYVADDDGFHATVSYEGEPAFPEVADVHHSVQHNAHPEPPPPPPPHKPVNRYRASNKVEYSQPTKFISPTPPPHLAVTTVTPVIQKLRDPPIHHESLRPHPPALLREEPHPPALLPKAPGIHHKSIHPVAPIKSIVKELPPPPPPPTLYTPTPAPTLYTPTTTSYTPFAHSPFPNFSPSPTPFLHSPTPPPYYAGSPTPPVHHLPHLETSTPVPEVTPAPIFHTTPSLILGLKASHPPENVHFGASSFNVPRQVPFSLSHGAPTKRHDKGYIPPTTWKPKYPKILEHTLRSVAAESYYGHRIKKGVKNEDRDTKDAEYDEY